MKDSDGKSQAGVMVVSGDATGDFEYRLRHGMPVGNGLYVTVSDKNGEFKMSVGRAAQALVAVYPVDWPDYINTGGKLCKLGQLRVDLSVR